MDTEISKRGTRRKVISVANDSFDPRGTSEGLSAAKRNETGDSEGARKARQDKAQETRRAKQRRVQVWFDPDEKSVLDEFAAKHNMPLSRLIRAAVFDVVDADRIPVSPRDRVADPSALAGESAEAVELRKLRTEIARVGVNLNQLVRANNQIRKAAAASGQKFDKSLLSDFVDTNKEIKKHAKDIYKVFYGTYKRLGGRVSTKAELPPQTAAAKPLEAQQ